MTSPVPNAMPNVVPHTPDLAAQRVEEYELRARAAEQSPYRVLLLIAKWVVWIIWFIVAVNAALLTLAFFLRLFGASPDSSFTEWVYRSTERAMQPFRGMFPTQELNGSSVFDASLLFGAIFYLIVALFIDGLHRWISTKIARQEIDASNARANADAVAWQYAQQHQVSGPTVPTTGAGYTSPA